MNEKTLNLLQKICNNYTIPIHKIEKPYTYHFYNDDLRKELNSKFNNQNNQAFLQSIPYHQFTIITDFMNVRYGLFIIPKTLECILLGPYKEGMGNYLNVEYLEKLGFSYQQIERCKEHYRKIPVVQVDFIQSTIIPIISTFFDSNFKVKYVYEHRPCHVLPSSFDLSKQEGRKNFDDEKIEKRIQYENEIMDAIYHGNPGKAIFVLDQLRNLEDFESIHLQKENLIILNTLFRKSLEQAHIHPYYVHEIYKTTDLRISLISNHKDVYRTQVNMITDYCDYVSHYSSHQYSEIIQKVIHLIQMNLSKDLTLQEVSEQMNVDYRYLSSLFKKETNCNFKQYVNELKMKKVAYDLRNTQSSIREIALSVGIENIPYFTTLFKRHFKTTPALYRKGLLEDLNDLKSA